jgi:GDPmannose 4,6-dehydratase
MEPTSPYGCAKVFGYNIVRHYRFAHKLFAVNGILFNHESPRRGANFVTNKVVKSAVKIKLGLQDELALGNMDSYRDWGHSKDYVRAMNMIVNHTEPDDFVVATGRTHSVREMCNYVFSKLDINYKDFITQDPRFMRAEELKYLKGDSSKIRKVLGWKPEYTFETLMDEMIEHWLKVYKK